MVKCHFFWAKFPEIRMTYPHNHQAPRATFQDIDEFVRKNAATCIREIARSAAQPNAAAGFSHLDDWVPKLLETS